MLLTSGRLDGDAVELDPLFVLDGVPQLLAAGPLELVGWAADGDAMVTYIHALRERTSRGGPNL